MATGGLLRKSDEKIGLRRTLAALPPFVVAIVFSLYFALLVRPLPPSGDEAWYLERATLVLDLLAHAGRLDWDSVSGILDRIVDRGWFMPGMSVLIALGTVFGRSIVVLRLYVGVLNFILVCLIARSLTKRNGKAAGTVFLLVPIVLPYYVIYSFLFWGDLLAAHAFLLLGLWLVDRIEACAGQGLRPKVGILLGLGLAMVTYLRGAYWVCLPLLLLGIFFSSFDRGSLRERLRHLVLVGGACSLVFGLTIAPWSLLVTRDHGFHVTTTSMTMSQIIAFGDRGHVDSIGDRSEPNLFHRVHRYIRNRATETERSFGEQASIELEKATDSLTPKAYLSRVRDGFRAYWLDSEAFMERFERISRSGRGALPPDWHRTIFDLAEGLNHRVWRTLLAIGILLFVIPIAPDRRNLSLSTLYKFTFFFFSLQPLFAVAHGRYYVQYVPFIAMALGTAIVALREGRFWPGSAISGLDEGIVVAGQVLALSSGAAILMLTFVGG